MRNGERGEAEEQRRAKKRPREVFVLTPFAHEHGRERGSRVQVGVGVDKRQMENRLWIQRLRKSDANLARTVAPRETAGPFLPEPRGW